MEVTSPLRRGSTAAGHYVVLDQVFVAGVSYCSAHAKTWWRIAALFCSGKPAISYGLAACQATLSVQGAVTAPCALFRLMILLHCELDCSTGQPATWAFSLQQDFGGGGWGAVDFALSSCGCHRPGLLMAFFGAQTAMNLYMKQVGRRERGRGTGESITSRCSQGRVASGQSGCTFSQGIKSVVGQSIDVQENLPTSSLYASRHGAKMRKHRLPAARCSHLSSCGKT